MEVCTMTDTKTKKRIFYPNRFYVVDKDNFIINQSKKMEDLAQNIKCYEPSDTILVSFPISELNKFVTKAISSVTFDFYTKKMFIEGDVGATLRMNLIDYDVGEYDLDDEEIKTWNKMYTDAKRVSKSVKIVGIPPIEGTYLEYDKDD